MIQRLGLGFGITHLLLVFSKIPSSTELPLAFQAQAVADYGHRMQSKQKRQPLTRVPFRKLCRMCGSLATYPALPVPLNYYDLIRLNVSHGKYVSCIPDSGIRLGSAMSEIRLSPYWRSAKDANVNTAYPASRVHFSENFLVDKFRIQHGAFSRFRD